MKIKNHQISNKNIVYVINNNTPTKKRKYKRKNKDNTTEMPSSSNKSSSNHMSGYGGIPSNNYALNDNRFLSSSNLNTEIQRTQLEQLNNPQLRLKDSSDTRIFPNNFEQKLLQIQDAINQQRQNTLNALNYYNNPFPSNPPLIEDISDEINYNDNEGNFGETLGSDSFTNEGNNKPQYDDRDDEEIQQTPQKQLFVDDDEPDFQNIPIKEPTYSIASSASSASSISPQQEVFINTTKLKAPKKRFSFFNVAKNVLPSTPDLNQKEEIQQQKQQTPEQQQQQQQQQQIPEQQPKIKVSAKEERDKLKEIYKSLGGNDSSILNTTRKKTITDEISKLKELKKLKTEFLMYGGNDDSYLLQSQSVKELKKAVKELKQF